MKQVIKASDHFIKSLEAEGVQMIFGIPGEENLDLVESDSKFNFILLSLIGG